MSVNFEYFPASARASTVAVEMVGQKRSLSGDMLPPKVLIVGQYDQSNTSVVEEVPIQMFSADQVGEHFGYGSEIYRQALWVFAGLGGFSENVWCVATAQPGTSTAAAGDIVFTGTSTSSGTFYFSVGGDIVALTVSSGTDADTAGDALADAINALVTLPVTGANTTGTVTVTCNWQGVTGNKIKLVLNPDGDSQETQNPTGLTVTVPGYLTTGAGDVDVEAVYFSSGDDNLGERWYTIIVQPYVDSTSLGHLADIGDERAKPETKRHFAAYLGYVTEDYTAAYAVPATINEKWICPVWDPRSLAPSFELSAAVAGVVAASNTFDPGRPYRTLAVGVPVDASTSNMLFNKYNPLYKAGMGYFYTDKSGNLRIGDIATSYRTNAQGAATEAWYDAVSIHRRQQKVYMIDLLFNSDPYTRGMLGSDDIVTGKSYVIKPKTIVTDLMNLVDVWAGEGWTKNPEDVKASIVAEINAGNNSRADAQLTDDEAQALRILAVKYAFLY